MAAPDGLKSRWAGLIGLRALLMFLAGLYALFSPGSALLLLVTVGALLLIIDGAIGLWALTFGGAKTGNYWFDVVRNGLAIVVGVLILLSPILATLLTVWFFVYLFAIQAIIVGVMEIMIAVRERALYSKIWPILLSGGAYLLLGLLLLFSPLMSALFLVSFAGAMMVVFSIGLFVLAWRIYQGTHGRA